jgi:predicted amidophosphoribosyltransferase
MEAIPLRQREKPAPERVLVIGERRCSSPPSCSTCGSRRKTWLRSLGWVCTGCFDQCKEAAEQCIEVGSGVARMRQAYERAILSYHAADQAVVSELAPTSSEVSQ